MDAPTSPLHPFSWIRQGAQKWVFLLLAPLSYLYPSWMGRLCPGLFNRTAPYGIVSFELARTAERAQAIVDSWSDRARASALLSLGLDYLYLVIYPAAIALGAVLVARRLAPRWRFGARFGFLIAWAVVLAGLFDAVENYALIRILQTADLAHWPGLAYHCAVAKFGLVVVGLFYLALGGILGVVLPKRRPAPG
jgi:hypothetical protein